MENVKKELEVVMFDLGQIISRAQNSRRVMEIALNEDHMADEEGVSPIKRLKNSIEYVTDSKHDFDSIADDVKEVLSALTDLLDDIEYESIANAAKKG